MRSLEILLLLVLLAWPANARFDLGFDTSPNRRYQVRLEDHQLVLRAGGKKLWSRTLTCRAEALQVSNFGQVSFCQQQQQLFLNPQGEEILRVQPPTWGSFSRVGQRYLAYSPGQEGLRELRLQVGEQYRVLDDQTLLSEISTGGDWTLDLLCMASQRGLHLSEPILARLEPAQAGWWTARRSRQGLLQAALMATPEIYWERAVQVSPKQLSATLPILLRTGGAAARQACAERWDGMSHEQQSRVVDALTLQAGGPSGALRPKLQEMARSDSRQGERAILALLNSDGVSACLAYLDRPFGRDQVLRRLAEQTESSSVPALLELLKERPTDDMVLQALRFQCRAGLGPDPSRWQEWSTKSSHSLEERLSLQSRHQLCGFLLRSWRGELTRADFAHVPRLAQVSEARGRTSTPSWHVKLLEKEKFCLQGPAGQTRAIPGSWWSMCLSPARDRLLGLSLADNSSQLLNLSCEPACPPRLVQCPGSLSPHGSYLQMLEKPQVCLLEMASGREIPLAGVGCREVVFSPDERQVAVAGSESWSLYELPSGRLLAEVPFSTPFASHWLADGLHCWPNLKEGWDYFYRFDALPTAAALEPSQQRLLAELWTGFRLQGGLAVRLSPEQWRERCARWTAVFGPGWEVEPTFDPEI